MSNNCEKILLLLPKTMKAAKTFELSYHRYSVPDTRAAKRKLEISLAKYNTYIYGIFGDPKEVENTEIKNSDFPVKRRCNVGPVQAESSNDTITFSYYGDGIVEYNKHHFGIRQILPYSSSELVSIGGVDEVFLWEIRQAYMVVEDRPCVTVPRLLKLMGVKRAPICAAVSEDGLVAVGGRENKVFVWSPKETEREELSNNVPVSIISPEVAGEICQIAFLEDGKIAFIDSLGSLYIWNLNTKERQPKLLESGLYNADSLLYDKKKKMIYIKMGSGKPKAYKFNQKNTN